MYRKRFCKNIRLVLCLAILSSIYSCKKDIGSIENTVVDSTQEEEILPQFLSAPHQAPDGMVFIPGKKFIQGAKDSDGLAMAREKPSHEVIVDGFYIDITEVTNDAFSAFAKATNYITVAERPIDWDELKKQLPKGTPKPLDSILQPGSMIFNRNIDAVVNMQNYAQWWEWSVGANWRHPEGPGSNIEGKGNFPVVHIAFEDALAYCDWANRKLPTEAQWESAAQGDGTNRIYTWGNDASQLQKNANTWNGQFPIKNTGEDGFEFIAPVKSYPPNSVGLYDISGNVWEWTQDVYNEDYYGTLGNKIPIVNPQGASIYKNKHNPHQEEIVMKGGSFLCHASYCGSYRISARMSTSKDSGSDHLGFRTIMTVDMLTP